LPDARRRRSVKEPKYFGHRAGCGGGYVMLIDGSEHKKSF
jgi:hypothetical protein